MTPESSDITGASDSTKFSLRGLKVLHLNSAHSGIRITEKNGNIHEKDIIISMRTFTSGNKY